MRKTWIVGLAALFPALAWAGSNLVVNASFENKEQALYGWQYKYLEEGESWYFKNHEYVSVVPENDGRKSVLRLNVADQSLADTQGVKVDSQPIPIKPGAKYRFSAWCRSTGPNCRIMVEGYKWRPNVTKHDNPTLYELRKIYKFKPLWFGEMKAGRLGEPSKTWVRASMKLPDEQLSPIAQKNFDSVDFLVVHVIGIAGTKGEVFVDDIELEQSN